MRRISKSRLLLGCLCFQLLVSISESSLNPILIKGYKFFDSVTGEPFIFRGIAYNPRPNHGNLNHNSVDYYTNQHRHIWERDLVHLQELGVNAIRLYSVDPDQSHEAFMCAMNAAGIYVIVELASDCPICAITRDKAPDCYPTELKTRGQKIVQEFARYSNTLAFSVGNEVNHFAPPGIPQWNAPCQKKFLRDMRAYIQQCRHLRQVPVGLVAADSDRASNAKYCNCQYSNDDLEAADWFGINSYVFCNGQVDQYKDSPGFVSLQKSFASYNYSIPVLLTEFGCLSETFPTEDGIEGQRDFRQAHWLWTEPDLREQFSGGFVFEYSIEKELAQNESPYPFKKFGNQNYGIGYFSPEDCDDLTKRCVYNPRPEFHHLKHAYDTALVDDTQESSRDTLDTFEIPEGRRKRTECPEEFAALHSFKWKADWTRSLSCPSESESTFTCPANLDDLLNHEMHKSKGHPWLTGAAAAAIVVTLVVAAVGYMIYRKRSEAEDPRWMTIVIPSVVREKSMSDESSSESTGLLSMQQLGEGATALYHAISDSSLENRTSTEEA